MVGYTRSKSKFKVAVLDMKAFSKSTTLYLIGNGYEIDGNTRISARYPLGIVTAANGKRYLIDEDGCGDGEALEDAKQEIEWYKSFVNEEGNVTSFSLVPFVLVRFTKEDIEAIPVTKTVTLDKFIRSFGDRVERLYGNWTKFLETGIVPAY
jgi:hypothetical protein